jgi:hypothetical protein
MVSVAVHTPCANSLASLKQAACGVAEMAEVVDVRDSVAVRRVEEAAAVSAGRVAERVECRQRRRAATL